jgi:hypothetical protein
MTDIVTSQNIDLLSWDTLYNNGMDYMSFVVLMYELILHSYEDVSI